MTGLIQFLTGCVIGSVIAVVAVIVHKFVSVLWSEPPPTDADPHGPEGASPPWAPPARAPKDPKPIRKFRGREW